MMISPKLFAEYLERLPLFKQVEEEETSIRREYFRFTNEAIAIFQSSAENYLGKLFKSALMACQFRGVKIVEVRDLQFVLLIWSSAFDSEKISRLLI